MDLRGFVLVSEQATKKLKTTTTDVTVGDSDVPTTGQVLTATSGSNATWQTLSLGGISGVTASVSELNILDGATLSTAELNLLDGAAPFFPTPNKCVVYGADSEVVAGLLSATAVLTDTVDLPFTGTLKIGPNSATKIEIADAGVETEIQGPTTLIQTVTFGTGGNNWTMPSTRGTAAQVLATNGSGIASWTNLPPQPTYCYVPLASGLASTPTVAAANTKYFIEYHLPHSKTFSTVSYFGLTALGNVRFAIYSGTGLTATLIAQTDSTASALGYQTLPLVLVSGSMTFTKGDGIIICWSNDNANEKLAGNTATLVDPSISWYNSTSLAAAGFGTNPQSKTAGSNHRPCIIFH